MASTSMAVDSDQTMSDEESQVAIQRHSCAHCDREYIPSWTYKSTQSDTWTYELRHTIPESYDAASEGCPFFEWICYSITRSETPAEQLARTKICLIFHTRRGHSDDMASVTVSLRTETYTWPVGGLEVLSEHDDKSAEFATARLIDGDITSPVAIRQIRRRLNECLFNHQDCQRQNPHIRPSRFISVDSRERDMVRIESSDPTRFDPYIALSYCWGAPQAVKTTLSSLAAHESGIPLASLPQTLQDAIIVTRELGVDFLWVDSLCIIQDSPEELAKEVGDMSHYYGNALVTLSASVPQSCTQGFLHDRGQSPQYVSGPFYFPISAIGRWGSAHIKLASQHNDIEAIETRAWTLQESLLSTRLVSFGARTIRWSCRFLTYGEPKGSNSIQLRNQLTSIRKTPRKATEGENKNTGLDGYKNVIHDGLFPKGIQWPVLRLWYRVVADYTSRILSVDEDKLPAVSGIAREFAPMLGPPSTKTFPKYLAGLWTSTHVGLQLLWTPRHIATRPQSYIAPTWSWASIKGPVCVGFFEDQKNEILDKSLVTPSLDNELRFTELNLESVMLDRVSLQAPYGALSGGSIIIVGTVLAGFHENLSDLGLRLSFDSREDVQTAETSDSLVCLEVIDPERGASILEKAERIDTLPKGILLVRNSDETHRRVGVYFQQYTESVVRPGLKWLGAERMRITIV